MLMARLQALGQSPFAHSHSCHPPPAAAFDHHGREFDHHGMGGQTPPARAESCPPHLRPHREPGPGPPHAAAGHSTGPGGGPGEGAGPPHGRSSSALEFRDRMERLGDNCRPAASTGGGGVIRIASGCRGAPGSRATLGLGEGCRPAASTGLIQTGPGSASCVLPAIVGRTGPGSPSHPSSGRGLARRPCG